MTIDDVLLGVLQREGWPKFTDHPADRGGPTKGGITLAALEAYRGRRCTVQDLRDLTLPEAMKLLRKRYVTDPGLDQIREEDLLVLAVDYAVHSWHDDPIKAIQRAVGVTVDGRFGPKTRVALAAADVRIVYRAVFLDRWRKLEALALDDSEVRAFLRDHPRTQLANLRGWMNRLRSLFPAPSTNHKETT